MATTIVTKNSSVALSAPSAGQLVQGELAVNVTDKKIYTLDGGGNVILLAAGGSPYVTPQVIQVTDNTYPALRITQLGTAAALLVEDSTNPDSSPFVIDASGVVVSGSTTAVNYGGFTPNIQVNAPGAAQIGLSRFSANATSNAIAILKSRGATVGDFTVLASGDALGRLEFYGADGTTGIIGAQIAAAVDGTPGTNDMPGRLIFSTTADGASSPTERMRIDSAGDVGIGTTTPVTKLEIAGTNNTAWSVTASITGTTMTVSAVTTSGVAVGDLVHGSGVQPYTRVTALGTGTGGIGTYTVSVSQTLASGTVVGSPTYGDTLIRITETDTAVTTGQPTGGLQFYTSDNSTPTAGVGAYVAGVAESSAPDTSLVFGTRDGSGGGIDANERMRIDSAGNVGIGTSSPSRLLDIATSNAGGSTLVSLVSATDGNCQLLFGDTASDTQGKVLYNNSGDHMAFDTANTERMRIDSSGNVGIGTTSPTSGLQTAGSSSKSAFKTPNIAEVNTISATAATGTIAYDVTTQSVLYYTTNASGNFTVNFRGSVGTSLNTIMATGESLSVTFLVTNGATAYYNSAVQVDGSSVTPKWQGGTAPTSGNASSIDSYTYVIIKTGSAAFTVLASQTKFA
jgi:hypothetical protein